MQDLEAVWVEITIKSKKILIGGFYRPPHSNTDYFNKINESIDRAYSTNIVDILITGDFNFNMFSNENNKMKELIQQYNLNQLIREPTHFTEHSASLIDLILVRNTTSIVTSGVADSFIPDQIRFHCPVLVLLKFLRPTVKSYKRRVWNYPLADFNKYREQLTNYDLQNKIESNSNIDDNVLCIADCIMQANQESIPNKIVTIRPNENPWITGHIKRLIRKRKRTFKKYKKTSNMFLLEKYKTLRNRVVNEIRKSKKEYFDKLEGLLSSASSNSKLFWKTSKQVLKTCRNSTNVPNLIYNNEHAESDIDKANMLNNYFSSQAKVADDDKNVLPLPRPQHTILSSFVITHQDIFDVLSKLDVSKACGPDLLSPRLLKEGASVFSNPLSTVFNRITEPRLFPIFLERS